MFMPPVFPAHWHVSQPVLIADTFSSLVWKVSLPDGTPAIVKGLKPIEDIADELRGADYLVWRNGRGAVRLLGRENNLMLLEYAGERMLSHIVAEHGDYQATEIAAELMAKLYAASEEPLPSALLPIRDRFAALFQRARDDQNAGCQTDYVHAAIIADQMMSNASELRGVDKIENREGFANFVVKVFEPDDFVLSVSQYVEHCHHAADPAVLLVKPVAGLKAGILFRQKMSNSGFSLKARSGLCKLIGNLFAPGKKRMGRNRVEFVAH